MGNSLQIMDPAVGWAGARRSYRTAIGTPSEKAKFISEEVKRARLESDRIQQSLDSMSAKNQMLTAENKAVKSVNAKLRDMVETRVPYVATPPAPLPAQPHVEMPMPVMPMPMPMPVVEPAVFGHPYGWGYDGSWGAPAAHLIKSRVVEHGGFLPAAHYHHGLVPAPAAEAAAPAPAVEAAAPDKTPD